MKSTHSRLVLEIPTTVYEELTELCKEKGMFKQALVSQLIHQRYIGLQKTQATKSGDSN